MATHYYNEWSRFAAAWIRVMQNLGELPIGWVDERSITDVSADDIARFKHVHLYAGIGGWALAARMAGWPNNVPLMTASLPCQPFSIAGKKMREADERHLWPATVALIEQLEPPIVVGEQTASKDGETWLAVVLDQMEALGYRVAAVDWPGCCVGSPQRRNRLYWLAYAPSRWQRQDREAIQGAHRRRRDFGSPWAKVEIRHAANGKSWPAKPGIELLVNGIPGHVEYLAGFGNAVVVPQARVFLETVMEIISENQ